VTNPQDAGPGSLREALFAAARAGGRARIVFDVARITLTTALPAVVSSEGVVIDAQDLHTEVNAGALPEGPVLDLAAPNCSLRGLTIRGAAGQGILVRGGNAHVEDVSVVDCAQGVYVVDGIRDLSVERSLFEANGVGVRLPRAATGVMLRGNRFRKNDQAALWGVSPTAPMGISPREVTVLDNHFEADRIGIVLINVPGSIEHNEFSGAGESAIYLTGPGLVRNNRVLGGSRFGIVADGPDGAALEDNEVSRNFAVGLLLRDARNTVCQRNRIHGNGFGIVVVFGSDALALVDNLVLNQLQDAVYVVGGSPVVRGNRLLYNRGAAFRVLDFVPHRGARRTAHPLLQDNVASGNGLDAPVRGEYRASASEEARE
jgi:parallel beta-helix repeat protein